MSLGTLKHCYNVIITFSVRRVAMNHLRIWCDRRHISVYPSLLHEKFHFNCSVCEVILSTIFSCQLCVVSKYNAVNRERKRVRHYLSKRGRYRQWETVWKNPGSNISHTLRLCGHFVHGRTRRIQSKSITHALRMFIVMKHAVFFN